jgi:hypothetical protein
MFTTKTTGQQVCRSLIVSAVAALISWSGIPASAQTAAGKSSSQMIYSHFDQLGMADPSLFSGTFYTDVTPQSTEGHPFSGSRDWFTGSVTKAGVMYNNLQLRYDISKNEIVCNTAGITPEPLQLALNRENITEFRLGNRRFIPFPSSDPDLAGRYCEILADGRNRLLLLETKKLKILANGTTSFAYETSARKLFYIGDSLVRYKGINTLISIYPLFRDPLKEFVRQNRPAFRKQPGTRDKRLVEYCNELLAAGQ